MISKSFPYNHEFFKIFEEICKIPHGSGNTKQLAEWCVEFANNHGCEAIVDKAGNVIIKRSAAKGFENVEPIIIQGHLDMVCEKEADSNHDFNTDGLKLEFDGKYISANGTTLGADDGVAVAFAQGPFATKQAERALAPVADGHAEDGAVQRAGITLRLHPGHGEPEL